MNATADLIGLIPFARRYARALTGKQAEGDDLVARALGQLDGDLTPRASLYAAITRLSDPGDGRGAMPPWARHLLLLTSVEAFSLEDAARVVGLDAAEAAERLAAAREAVKSAVVTSVLIIEDEPIIAMDLRLLVESCGHTVIGVAGTEAQAVRIAAERSPGLILADINLGRGGNGIAAVRRILSQTKVPVIFVTAYPQDLLKAEGIEPAFVMRKPFDHFMLATFTYQAVSAGYVPLP